MKGWELKPLGTLILLSLLFLLIYGGFKLLKRYRRHEGDSSSG